MGKKKHVSWNLKEQYHQDDTTGCIWRHSGGYGKTACHYAMNGYKVSAGRQDMYNKDHRKNAVALGYVLDVSGDNRRRGDLKLTSKISREVRAKARTARKTSEGREAFRKRFEGRFGGSIKWLSLDKDGWHYGYTLPVGHVPRKYMQGPQPTFKVKNGPAEGYGAWYPYHHNYHHLVPQGALLDFVCGNDDKTRRRVEILCASKWNINGPNNIVLLPQETSVSKIVELPAHCPWGQKKHSAYSRSMKDMLKDVKRNLDKAMKTKACEDTEEVAVELDAVSKKILQQIKTMPTGRQIGRVQPS
ncbi:AHH domain-containing protein [Myxococcus qinghaiensis]|uniref:AHH domain-containing protein n=1 Tax=Myxococcus qinghaiensis TaxID=2906758 RepID=UPI0020A7BABA|nr:AHH domain-containing protein [Myxococcus qinghaiensis]MCP3168175.1 AHH domain-containing protein [Myxococcus qinghaiensis]